VYHEERLAFWRAKREEVLERIRSEGLEIDEKIVMAYPTPKAQDWSRANRVTVRDDLREHLDECLAKLREHTELLRDHGGWVAMLTANPEARLPLDVEDWTFFFGAA
jgi:prophage antirepressor-like protein